MKFDTVCFLFEIPPLITYYERYELNKFSEAGYAVEVFDLSPILHPIALESNPNSRLVTDTMVSVRVIESISQLKERLLSMKNNVFIWSTLPLSLGSYPIIKKVSKYPYGFICNLDFVPTVHAIDEVNWKKKLKKRLKRITISNLLESVLHYLPRNFMPIKKAYAVVSFEKNIREVVERNAVVNKNTKYICVDTLDYNEYSNNLKNSKRLKEGKYCVFIDQFFPLHPDGKEAGIKVSADNYYNEMTRLLQNAEAIMQMPVVIAAHPKANYALYNNYFKEFEIFQFLTCPLIKDAELVISHASISLSYVMLFGKPLLLVATQEMLDEKRTSDFLKSYQEILNVPIYNISKQDTREDLRIAIDIELAKPAGRYVEIVQKYIKSDFKNNEARKGFFDGLNEIMVNYE